MGIASFMICPYNRHECTSTTPAMMFEVLELEFALVSFFMLPSCLSISCIFCVDT